jgi:HEAT repeat protein
MAAFGNGNVTLKNSELIRSLPLAPSASGELMMQIRELVATTTALSVSQPVPLRLARQVLEETIPDVRLRKLMLLQERYRDSEEAAHASRDALASKEPLVRLHAALYLAHPATRPTIWREGGIQTLLELAAPGTIGDQIQAHALRGLWLLDREHLDSKRLEPILLAQIRRGARRPQRLAIEEAGRLELVAAIEPIRRIAHSVEIDDTAVAAAEALARVAGENAEKELILLLAHRSSRVREVAVRWLAERGTVRAVPALRECEASASMGSKLKRSAADAVVLIQTRARGETGQLTLAEQGYGALSLSASIRGRGALSLPEPAAGGLLSLTDRTAKISPVREPAPQQRQAGEHLIDDDKKES